MFVRSWMSAPPVVIPPVMPAGAALEFMNKHEIRRLPVVQDGSLLGIITRSDLEAALGRRGEAGDADGKTVSDLMATKLLTVEPDETLERAASLMLENKVSGLPVVRDGEVVGIITESDIFGALVDILGMKQQGARVVMTVGEDEDLLDTIRKRLSGLALHSLTTWKSPTGGKWEVVLRVRGHDPKAKAQEAAK